MANAMIRRAALLAGVAPLAVGVVTAPAQAGKYKLLSPSVIEMTGIPSPRRPVVVEEEAPRVAAPAPKAALPKVAEVEPEVVPVSANAQPEIEDADTPVRRIEAGADTGEVDEKTAAEEIDRLEAEDPIVAEVEVDENGGGPELTVTPEPVVGPEPTAGPGDAGGPGMTPEERVRARNERSLERDDEIARAKR